MSGAPAVSVLLPVRDGVRYLGVAIQSVLGQSLPDFELLVLDDGSRDGSAELAESIRDPRLRVLRNPEHRGLARSLNDGLREARAVWVARQDADDVSHPLRLERELGALRERPELALVGTQAWLIDSVGRRRGTLEHAREHAAIRWEMLFDNAFFHSAVMFRREAVLALGGYDESFRYCQDYELWSRLLERHAAANLGERLVSLRAHAASMTETLQGDNLAENERVVGRNLGALLGGSASAADLRAALAFRGPADDAAVAELVALWDRLLARFPETGRSTDFRRTLGRQWLQLAANRRSRSLPRSLRLVAEALRWRLPILGTGLRMLAGRLGV